MFVLCIISYSLVCILNKYVVNVIVFLKHLCVECSICINNTQHINKINQSIHQSNIYILYRYGVHKDAPKLPLYYKVNTIHSKCIDLVGILSRGT